MLMDTGAETGAMSGDHGGHRADGIQDQQCIAGRAAEAGRHVPCGGRELGLYGGRREASHDEYDGKDGKPRPRGCGQGDTHVAQSLQPATPRVRAWPDWKGDGYRTYTDNVSYGQRQTRGRSRSGRPLKHIGENPAVNCGPARSWVLQVSRVRSQAFSAWTWRPVPARHTAHPGVPAGAGPVAGTAFLLAAATGRGV